ncbi:glutaredoxin [Planoprotostelium fungivorum]|uniref:Glutaredoxin-like protein n=1 Tax=Planoprotostelium fungivorum TaxID=1890364 RepID=A0A2P6NCU2_9EUKA|nr:glutaredoxin [Planoprotostelium fungivorum]
MLRLDGHFLAAACTMTRAPSPEFSAITESFIVSLSIRDITPHRVTKGNYVVVLHTLKMRGLTAKFFTKPGCTLCVPALQAVERAQLKIPFVLEKVDISKDRQSWNKYKFDIPVLTINDKEVARHRMTEEQILNFLNQESTIETNELH